MLLDNTETENRTNKQLPGKMNKSAHRLKIKRVFLNSDDGTDQNCEFNTLLHEGEHCLDANPTAF